MSKMKLCKDCSKEISISAKVCPHCGAKLKKSKLKLIGIVAAVIVVLIIAASALGSNSSSSNYVDVVKTGYLGNYKSVTVETVFTKMFTKCTWNSYESDDNKNIVEADLTDEVGTPVKIQFAVNTNNKFSVVYIESNGKSPQEAYSAKIYLDALYDEYGKKYDGSVVCDPSTSNDTLSGKPSDKYKK